MSFHVQLDGAFVSFVMSIKSVQPSSISFDISCQSPSLFLLYGGNTSTPKYGLISYEQPAGFSVYILRYTDSIISVSVPVAVLASKNCSHMPESVAYADVIRLPSTMFSGLFHVGYITSLYELK